MPSFSEDCGIPQTLPGNPVSPKPRTWQPQSLRNLRGAPVKAKNTVCYYLWILSNRATISPILSNRTTKLDIVYVTLNMACRMCLYVYIYTAHAASYKVHPCANEIPFCSCVWHTSDRTEVTNFMFVLYD